MLKNYIIIVLTILCGFLFLLLLEGRFCRCSSVTCPINKPEVRFILA